MELGYCPTIATMVREEGYMLRRWFCGLPSATPYCQAGIFHGENDGIPARRAIYSRPYTHTGSPRRWLELCESPRRRRADGRVHRRDAATHVGVSSAGGHA